MYNKKRKAIFFDIDGTLLASGEGIHESVREALKKVRKSWASDIYCYRACLVLSAGRTAGCGTGRAYCQCRK